MFCYKSLRVLPLSHRALPLADGSYPCRHGRCPCAPPETSYVERKRLFHTNDFILCSSNATYLTLPRKYSRLSWKSLRVLPLPPGTALTTMNNDGKYSYVQRRSLCLQCISDYVRARHTGPTPYRHSNRALPLSDGSHPCRHLRACPCPALSLP